MSTKELQEAAARIFHIDEELSRKTEIMERIVSGMDKLRDERAELVVALRRSSYAAMNNSRSVTFGFKSPSGEDMACTVGSTYNPIFSKIIP